MSSLAQDVEELDELLAHLSCDTPSGGDASPPPTSPAEASRPERNIVLIGHSTGCQDAVFYMAHGRPELRALVRGVVLQAPVSDRDYRETLPETEGLVRVAREMAPEQLMPVHAEEAPITSKRFLSLSTRVSWWPETGFGQVGTHALRV